VIVSGTIEGPSEKTFRKIEAEAENFRQALRQTFFFMGKTLKTKTRKAITSKKGKTGHVYFIKRTVKSGKNKGAAVRRRHRASAPGETHANLSGKLRDSIGWQVHGTNSLEFGYGVEPSKPAPEHASIEFEHNGQKANARPSLRNNIEGSSFETFFEKALDKLAGK